MHNKKLERFPILFGTTFFLQEFIVTNRISKTCILGGNAIFLHGFIVDDQSKIIFFARNRFA